MINTSSTIQIYKIANVSPTEQSGIKRGQISNGVKFFSYFHSATRYMTVFLYQLEIDFVHFHLYSFITEAKLSYSFDSIILPRPRITDSSGFSTRFTFKSSC